MKFLCPNLLLKSAQSHEIIDLLRFELVRFLCLFPDVHCVKSVRIWSFSDPYFPVFRLNTLSVFSPNAGKYRPEKLRIQTLFTQ